MYKEIAIQNSEHHNQTSEAEIRSTLRADAILNWWDQRWYMNFIGLLADYVTDEFAELRKEDRKTNLADLVTKFFSKEEFWRLCTLIGVG